MQAGIHSLEYTLGVQKGAVRFPLFLFYARSLEVKIMRSAKFIFCFVALSYFNFFSYIPSISSAIRHEGLPELSLAGSSHKSNDTRLKEDYHLSKNYLMEERKDKYREGELLVKFKSTVSAHIRKKLHEYYGTQVIKEFQAKDIQHVRLKQGIGIEDAIKLYNADPNVEYAEPNYIVTIRNTPDDPRFGDLWGLHNTGQTGGTAGADIKAPEAWNVTTGNNNVVVAVVDTGVDYYHEDLASNVWMNTGEIPGNGIDDDGNGYVDDVFGIDTYNHDSNPMDDKGHGTHVSGTIGAAGNNGTGVVGVNWNIKIMACKFLDQYGVGAISGAIECLQYIKEMKDRGTIIVATNNSWGSSGYSQALYDAIDAQREILFIGAAGNSSFDNDKNEVYPANYALPNVLSVAATDHSDAKASFSDYGRRTVHVGAPGVDIVSLRAAGTDMYGDGQHFIPGGDPNAQYYKASGTSMATPHVTGLAALIKAQNTGRDWRAIKNLILSGGDTVASMNGVTITGKRINAYGSLSCSNRPIFSILNYPLSLTVGTPVTLSALSVNCEVPLGPVTVTTFLGGEIINLHDDGIVPDLAAGDGIFSGTWTPSREAESLIFSSPAGTETVVTPPLSISSYLPEGNVRLNSYYHTLTATGGLPPYRWALISGTLPPELTFNSSTGEISGTVTVTWQTELVVQVTDSSDATATKSLLLRIVDEPVVEEWARTYPHRGDDLGWGMAVDGNGNVYVTGESHPGSFYSPSSDYLTVKYDTSGNMVWSRTFDRGGKDEALSAALDAAGNVYIVGRSHNGSYDDGLIVKYDPSGDVLWTRVTPPGYGHVDIAVDGTSNIYVTGGAGTVKYDSLGNQLLVKDFPGGNSYLVAVDNNGNVYVAGIVSFRTVIVKYDGSGNKLWVRTLEPSRDLCDMAVDNRNGYLYIVSSNTPGILKYDLSGNLVWSRTDLRAYGVVVDGDGNMYLSGYSCCSGYDFSALTLKYDSDFNLLWSKTYETVKSDVAFKIGLDNHGSVYVAGWSEDEDFEFLAIKYSDQCTYTLSSDASFSAAGGTGSVTVTTRDGCSWTAISNASWIAITSDNSGIGSGTVNYAVSANPSENQRTGTITIAGQTFTVTQAGAGQTYSISGRVRTASGAAIAGVTMTLTGAGSGTATTNSYGNYKFTALTNGSYTVTPSKDAYTFTPPNRSVTVSGANRTGQNFTGTPAGGGIYSISGKVRTASGAAIPGVTMTLTGSGTVTTNSYGNYRFTGLANGIYTVTPSKTGYAFTPPDRTVTISDANMTRQNFTGTPQGPYNVADYY